MTLYDIWTYCRSIRSPTEKTNQNYLILYRLQSIKLNKQSIEAILTQNEQDTMRKLVKNSLKSSTTKKERFQHDMVHMRVIFQRLSEEREGGREIE